jgi:hypothetical protein
MSVKGALDIAPLYFAAQLVVAIGWGVSLRSLISCSSSKSCKKPNGFGVDDVYCGGLHGLIFTFLLITATDTRSF